MAYRYDTVDRGRIILSRAQRKEVNALSDDARAYYYRRLRFDGWSHDDAMNSIARIEQNARTTINLMW